MSLTTLNIEFVFVHSYSSTADNWTEVVLGRGDESGRLSRAQSLATNLKVPLVSNDATDAINIELYEKHGIRNLKTALNTQDEVRSALAASKTGAVLFVSSPDHLPRVVRDAMAHGETHAFFAASDIAFSTQGAAAVELSEPAHKHAGDGKTIGTRR